MDTRTRMEVLREQIHHRQDIWDKYIQKLEDFQVRIDTEYEKIEEIYKKIDDFNKEESSLLSQKKTPEEYNRIKINYRNKIDKAYEDINRILIKILDIQMESMNSINQYSTESSMY